MEPISDIAHATAVAGSVCAGLDTVRGTAFWKIPDDDLLSLAETLERVGRLVYAAQVHLTGELDTRRVFQEHGAVSTAALLRQRLCISPGEIARAGPRRPGDPAAGSAYRWGNPTGVAGVAGRVGRRDGRRRTGPHRSRHHGRSAGRGGPGVAGVGAGLAGGPREGHRTGAVRPV